MGALDFTKPKKDDPNCRCVEGRYQCGRCEAEDYRRAGRRMSQADHAYDRFVTGSQRGEDE